MNCLRCNEEIKDFGTVTLEGHFPGLMSREVKVFTYKCPKCKELSFITEKKTEVTEDYKAVAETKD